MSALAVEAGTGIDRRGFVRSQRVRVSEATDCPLSRPVRPPMNLLLFGIPKGHEKMTIGRQPKAQAAR